MKYKLLFLITGISLLTLNACSDQSETDVKQETKTAKKVVQQPAKTKEVAAVDRWYGFSDVSKGGKLFQENCASCHQKDASGTKNWKQTDAKGRYPAPPLNGDAHAWHHPMVVLQRTVKNGGAKFGGWMPGFKDKLSDQEITSIIAWVQTHWSDKKYALWHGRNEQAGKPISSLKK